MATNAQVLGKVLLARDAADKLAKEIKNNHDKFDPKKLTTVSAKDLEAFNTTLDSTMKAIRNIDGDDTVPPDKVA